MIFGDGKVDSGGLGSLLEILLFLFLVVGNGWDFSYELLIWDWFDRKT